MQAMQQLAELHTHKEITYYPDDLPSALQYYGARIGRDLGKIHELTEGKIIVGSIVEMATLYEHLMNQDETPDSTPADFFKDVAIPAMEAELTQEEHPDGIDVNESSDSTQG